tara:strand:+ start:2595 stop:2909 length:315 start_codon:yes stop_codon:yes gene_type:complete
MAGALARDPNIAGYMELNDSLNPPAPAYGWKILNDLVFWKNNILSLIQNGIPKIKRAVVGGNYHRADGLGFGGMEKQPSVRVIEEYLTHLGTWDRTLSYYHNVN